MFKIVPQSILTCLTWNLTVYNGCLGFLGDNSGCSIIYLNREHRMNNACSRWTPIWGPSRKPSLTSIFLPSTIVPLSFSRARSASIALSKVTNPKPYRIEKVTTVTYLPSEKDQGAFWHIFLTWVITHLWTSLIEDDLHIQNLAELLKIAIFT